MLAARTSSMKVGSRALVPDPPLHLCCSPCATCSYDGWLCLMSRNVREPAVLFAMHLMVPDHPGVMR